jgi:hypothetical protein
MHQSKKSFDNMHLIMVCSMVTRTQFCQDRCCLGKHWWGTMSSVGGKPKYADTTGIDAFSNTKSSAGHTLRVRFINVATSALDRLPCAT